MRPGVRTFGPVRRTPRLTPTGCWALLIASALLVGGCTGWALQPARAAAAPRWGLSPTPSPAPTWTPAGADAHETPPAAPHAAVSAPEPAATPAATRYAPASRGGRDAVRELAERYFPARLVAWAVRTAACESHQDLYAHSAGYDRRLGVYYSFWGALQVDEVSWGAKAWQLFGGPLAEPDINFAMAAWIATNLGVGHWPVCGR